MSYNVYPVQRVEPECDSYEVYINGERAELNTARVSAYPFNRRWPGHQRDINQSTPVNFLSMAIAGEVEFDIVPKNPFEEVIIRPLSLGITPEIEGGHIRFTLKKPAYFTVEPYGRADALHIFADSMPNYEIDKLTDNIIYFGAGEHDVGLMELKSGQTLFIDEGAVVYATIHATDAQNIAIIGRGILDNSRNKEKILFEASGDGTVATENAERLHTVELNYCSNILIEGITIRDSLVYNIKPICCDNMHIESVKLIGNWRYNSDGIDSHNCHNLSIKNCFIRTFDDCICAKGLDPWLVGKVDVMRGGKDHSSYIGVHVTDCVLWNDWGKCLEIGAETNAIEMTDIIYENCDIIHVTGHALDCMNVDNADVHDVIFRNINVEYDDIPCVQMQIDDSHAYEPVLLSSTPFLVVLEILKHFEYSTHPDIGKIHDVLFDNIRVFGKFPPKMVLSGYDDEHKVENITFSNFYYNGKKVENLMDCIEQRQFCENIKAE